MSGAQDDHKRVLDPLELALEILEGCHMGRESNTPGPLEEQLLLSTTGPSLQLPKLGLMMLSAVFWNFLPLSTSVSSVVDTMDTKHTKLYNQVD